MNGFREFQFGTMLDEPQIVRTGAARVIGMGSPSRFCTSDPPNGTSCSHGTGASIAQTVAGRAALSTALPLGRTAKPSERPAYSAQPVPLSVVFGTGEDSESLDDAEALCLVCFFERWRCQCYGGEGVQPR